MIFKVGPVVASVNILDDDSDIVQMDEEMLGQWIIHDFYSSEKKSGKARECLAQVVACAKSDGIRFIALHPYARQGIDQASLVRFYESIGFCDCGYAFVLKV